MNATPPSRALRADTVLRLAPNASATIASASEVVIACGEARVSGGPFALAILEAFLRPVTFSEAMAALKGRIASQQDLISLTSTVHALFQAGVLMSEDDAAGPGQQSVRGFDSPRIHTVMLNDRVRTGAYLDAIARTVRPGDVVVDLGTGTGVLAMAAARAGAARVYAIEAGDIGHTARTLFEANGLADRITLIPGWSTRVTLPERADVLVSEIIGDDPLGENVLESTADAVQRHLKPGARLVPGRVRLMALPVALPPEELERNTFTGQALARWKDWYGIDFAPLSQALGGLSHSFKIKPQKAAGWSAMTEPLLLADFDLTIPQARMVDVTAEATALADGEVSALLVYFELELAPGLTISTHPAKADAANHWLNVVWVPPRPIGLRAGDPLAAAYHRNVPGKPDGVELSAGRA